MPLDHYVTLGRSGLRVSPLCLGAMTFGQEWGWGSTPKDSAKILDAYLARGGNFIDIANAYTKGHSEKIIGDHLGKNPARRDRAVIATKFYTNLYRGDPNGGGANRKSIMAACEQSLRRLQTEYIDLYWMHAWDSNTPIVETMKALDDLVASGKVRYVGFVHGQQNVRMANAIRRSAAHAHKLFQPPAFFGLQPNDILFHDDPP